jgi:hypothetical protein
MSDTTELWSYRVRACPTYRLFSTYHSDFCALIYCYRTCTQMNLLKLISSLQLSHSTTWRMLMFLQISANCILTRSQLIYWNWLVPYANKTLGKISKVKRENFPIYRRVSTHRYFPFIMFSYRKKLLYYIFVFSFYYAFKIPSACGYTQYSPTYIKCR